MVTRARRIEGTPAAARRPRRYAWLRRLAVAVALIATTPALAAGRWDDFTGATFHNLSIDNGLPRQATRQVIEDADGFLWVGAYGGLTRWDGYRFHVYEPAPRQPGGLHDNFIQVMHNDAAGRLWLGTTTAGLIGYDRATDGFVSYRAGRDGLSHDVINGLADDGRGGLWIATAGGLDRFDTTTGRAAAEHPATADGAEIDRRVEAVLRDRRGALWIGTAGGLYRRAAEGRPFEKIALESPAAVAGRLFEDEGGRMWVGTNRDGAFLVEPGAATGRRIGEADVDRPDLPGERVTAFVQAAPDQVWIATQTKGIVVAGTDGQAFQRIRSIPAVPSSLPDNGVNGMYVDRSGLLWVATARGIGHVDLTQTGLTVLFGGAPGRRQVSESNFTAVAEMPDGRIWLGLRTQGIDILDPERGTITRIVPDPARPGDALPVDRVLSIAAGPDGSAYAGTEKGLFRIAADGSTVRRLTVPGRPADGRVDAVLVDGGDLWFGGQPGGVWRLPLDPASGPARQFGPDGMTDPRVTVLKRGPDGAIWIGTWQGLNRLDPATGRIEAWKNDIDDPASVNRGFVAALFFDRRDRLWIATLAGGLGLMEGRNAQGIPRFRRFTTVDGLPNNSPNMVLEDRAGRIWTSSDHGMASIDPDDFSMQVLREADGVTVRNFWVHSGTRTRAGELLFGGTGGLVMIDPARLTRSTFQAPVVVTDVRIDDAAVAPGPFNAASPPPLVVPAQANSFAVEFASLDFAAPQRLRYRYRLVGFDSDWNTTGAARRVARYTNLWPGDYRLQIAGTNSDGDWSARSRDIPVRIEAAWYQTQWAMFGAGMLAVALFAGGIQLRTAQLRRRRAELETQVDARTADLVRANEALVNARAELERLAGEDTLTGLPNRRLFLAQLELGLDRIRRQGGRLAVLFLDLDNFKGINDRLGHHAGDRLLHAVADRLRARLKPDETLARLGGDEFVVLVEGVVGDTEVAATAQALIDTLSRPFPLKGGGSWTVGVSVGVALCPEDGTTADDLLHAADRALYAAKAAGRGTWRLPQA